VYKHLDLGVLSNQLREHPDKTKVIVTESTFSMDGDSPNFSELVDICVRNNAALIVDESHSVGMHGNQGVGTLDLANIPAELCAFKIFGFGKALGLQGGAWCGPTLLKNFLVNFSRSHMYSTALSPLLLNLVKERIADIRTNNDRRIKLKTNLNFFYACMKHLLTPPRNASPIILVHLGREENVIDAETKFRNLGFYVRGVRYPTVAKGNARLRIIIRADHTTSQIKDFAECLCNFLEEKSRQEDINKYREFSNDSP
jgi:7-keto-8-aminopelargonate synthetase-like enzyme